MVPLDALDQVDMTLPYLERLLRCLNAPKVYFRLTGSCQLSVILPSNIKDRTGLLKEIERLLLYVRWVPHENVRLVATRSHECVRFVPARADQMSLRSKESLDLALDVPDPRYIIVRTRQQIVSLIAPLY